MFRPLMMRAALAIAALTTGVAGVHGQEVKVGINLPYSGIGAEIAQQVDRGLELYLKLNPEKLKPYTIKLIKRDVKNPGGTDAKIAVQELFTQDNVDIVTGWVYSPNAIATAPIITAGKKPAAAAVAKTYGALGLRQDGIRLIGPGDITVDNKLQGMGPSAVGIVTMHHYNADLDNPENKRFVAAWKKEYGQDTTPDFTSVGGYDGMAAIVHVIAALKGKVDSEGALAALKGWSFNSPRGPIMIDPDTRDIVMNEYLSEVVMGSDGKLHQKVIGVIERVKDACKELKVGPCATK
jgi:ABC-type branched-subunit amino acid transport system substrate-binding protein